MTEHCENCRFYAVLPTRGEDSAQLDYDSGRTVCRYNPPPFPNTNQLWWCRCWRCLPGQELTLHPDDLARMAADPGVPAAMRRITRDEADELRRRT